MQIFHNVFLDFFPFFALLFIFSHKEREKSQKNKKIFVLVEKIYIIFLPIPLYCNLTSYEQLS